MAEAASDVLAPGQALELSNALRSTASRAAQRLSEGVALVFARTPGEDLGSAVRLRAAAGFSSPEEARRSSEFPEVVAAVKRGEKNLHAGFNLSNCSEGGRPARRRFHR